MKTQIVAAVLSARAAHREGGYGQADDDRDEERGKEAATRRVVGKERAQHRQVRAGG